MKESKWLGIYIIITLLIILAIILCVIYLDLININKYLCFSKSYDWLGFIGAIVGGLVSAVVTFLSLYISFNHERKIRENEDKNNSKREGYSYATLVEKPLEIVISEDSITSLDNIKDYYCILYGENVMANMSNYIDIILSLKNINKNYPSGAILKKINLIFNPKIINNNIIYKDSISLTGIDTKYKKLTLRNSEEFSFCSRALINNNDLKLIVDKLVNSDTIDIKAEIDLVNPNGVITSASYSANLILEKTNKKGAKNILGSNKIILKYNSENTYLMINKIDYIDECETIKFK